MTKTKRRKASKPVPARGLPLFLVFGLASSALLVHLLGIFYQAFPPSLWWLSLDDALILAWLEVLVFPFIAGLFLVKMVVWWHDRPRVETWYRDSGTVN